jgi:hypothetical protein
MKKELVYYKKQQKLIFSRLHKADNGRYCKSCAYDDRLVCNLYMKYDIDYNELLCAQDIYKDRRDDLDKNYMYVAEKDNTV